MTNQYKYGRKKEELVTRKLRGKGAKVKLSSGSRGAADLIAEFPSGKKWHVQVKATRKGRPASPSSKDTGRLKSSASKNRATPVIAKVSRNKVSYSSVRNKRRLNP
ncbi:hypothetical protein DRN85_08340 [Methanosarcinales archaeon]|nr:MAG: hypothetical protein DRN85_08340 [Methanosarcinales archaeon]